MIQPIFIIGLSFLICVAIIWGYKILPAEKWQILATIPRHKAEDNSWKGMNLTYYGLFSANAYTFAALIFLILASSLKIPLKGICVFIILLLAVCIPASRFVAQIVEKKNGTLTVGGAVFVGSLIAPWLIVLINLTLGQSYGFKIPVIIMLSAILIAYTFGEGFGRLACISFGCCYGKPLCECSPFVQKIFSKFYLVFHGETKKISYASGLQGQKVIPIQVVTAIIYNLSGLAGIWLFLNNLFFSALLETLVITQVWRFFSEFFRADFRGKLKITPYQIMSAGTILYTIIICFIFPLPNGAPDLKYAFGTLWDPWIFLFLQCLWIISFFHTGRSTVTGSQIRFHVVKNKI